MHEYVAEYGPVCGMAASRDANVVVCGHRNGVIVIRDIGSHWEQKVYHSSYDQGGDRLAVSADGRHVCAAGFYEGIQLIDSQTGRTVWSCDEVKQSQQVYILADFGLCAAVLETHELLFLQMSNGTVVHQTSRVQESCLVYKHGLYIAITEKQARIVRLPDHYVVAECSLPVAAEMLVRLVSTHRHVLAVDINRDMYLIDIKSDHAQRIRSISGAYWDTIAVSASGNHFLATSCRSDNGLKSIYEMNTSFPIKIRMLLENAVGEGHSVFVNKARMVVVEYDEPMRIPDEEMRGTSQVS